MRSRFVWSLIKALNLIKALAALPPFAISFALQVVDFLACN